jgi:toxin HigB-1
MASSNGNSATAGRRLIVRLALFRQS